MERISKRNKEKLMHEKEIVAAAERIFCLNGYDDASMDEIAKEARFTKRTVYQHFENKDELYFAVVLKGLKKLFSKVVEESEKGQSGYEKLELFCRSYDQLYIQKPDFIRLVSLLGYVQRKSAEEGRYKSEFIQFNNSMFHRIEEIMEEGQEDGSIQSGQDAGTTALCLMFLITGFYNQLSASGDHFKEYASPGGEDLCFHTIELLIKPLKRNKAITATRKGTA